MNQTTSTDAHGRSARQALIDVREPDEWAAGHAPGAHHVPLGTLAGAELPEADEYLMICRSGGRSAEATAALESAGLTATNVAGGMNAWADAGLPVVTDAGTPGIVC